MIDDDEYEYEYIELAEGEELPEGAEYEYVEVSAEEVVEPEVKTEPEPEIMAEPEPESEVVVEPEPLPEPVTPHIAPNPNKEILEVSDFSFDDEKEEETPEPELVLEESVDDILNGFLDDETPLELDDINIDDISVSEPEPQEITYEEPLEIEDASSEEKPSFVPLSSAELLAMASNPVSVEEPEEISSEPVFDETSVASTIEEPISVADSTRLYQVVPTDFSEMGGAHIFSNNGKIGAYSAENDSNSAIIEIKDEAELASWNVIVFDKKLVSVDNEVKEYNLPMESNAVRYAQLIKAGELKLDLFNEDKFKFMVPTEEFVKIKGRFIYGDVEHNSGLIIDDLLTISATQISGQKLKFNHPVSGIITGPEGTLVYFFELESIGVRVG